jgi:hypothetical protein
MTRTAPNRSKRRLVGALLCAGLVSGGCAGHATAPLSLDGSQADDPTTTAPSTTSTTRPSTATAAPPKRIEVDGGVSLVVPARLDLRVAGTTVARDDDPNLRGTIVEMASTEGTYLSDSFEISFPRNDQPVVPTFSSFRVAYYDPAAERWVALPTTIGADRLSATATIASRYALVQWNSSTATHARQRWPLPDRASRLDVGAPNCGSPPPWLRDVFTSANSGALLKACIENIDGGLRIRVVNNTTIPLPVVFNREPKVVTLTDVPERAWSIQPYLDVRRTSRRVLTGPGVAFTADFTVAPETDAAITVHVEDDPGFSSMLYLFEILDLAAPGRTSSLGALSSGSGGDARSLEDAIAACILDEPITQPTWEIGNPFPYVKKTIDCVVGRLDSAIDATTGSRSVETTLRDLSLVNPAKSRSLGRAIALRNMLRGAETVAMYWDLIAEQPPTLGDEIVATWGPQPQTTIVTEYEPSLLFGVPLGADADQAITVLTRLLRQPTSEWEWSKGCPLFDPAPTVRALRWGALQVNFTRDASGDHFDGWSYQMGSDYGPAVGGPTPDRFVFPNGVKLGMTMGEVAEALGRKLGYWSVFQHLSVHDEGTHDYGRKQYYGVGEDSLDTKFTGYSEPGLVYCE